MKTLIIALIGLLAVTLGAPLAEARDKHHDHDRNYRSHSSYRSYPRSYSYRSYGYRPYYSGPRYYSYYRDPYAPRYYYTRRPALTFSFGL
jgi:hypothetical protein